MAATLLNWIYICFTTFAMGFAFSKFVEKALGYHIKGMDNLIAIGLVIATVYAQFFSLMYQVGFAANMLLLLGSIVVYAAWHKEIKQRWFDTWAAASRVKKILVPVLVIIWAYCTSRGYMHYDSDLYHAQSIRWIEEYGVVKGLGNIHVRFAYNSSFFALSALYSMKPLLGQSLHTINGLIALLLSLEVLRLIEIWKRKGILLSDFARLGAFYYLTVIYREIIAPASDYAIMCIIFYLITKWIAQLEADRTDTVPFALLCVGGVYAVSVKLTAGLILLLVVKPAFVLLREKRWKEIAIYVSMGLIVLLPWMARTAMISGYLLYPFPALDVLAVDWKIPSAVAAVDAAEIKTWGRGLNNAALVNMGMDEWAPNWFHTMLPTVGKLLIIADLICVAIAAFWAIYLMTNRKRRTAARIDSLLVLISVVASYLFWQFSAPLLRYGYAYVLLTVMLTIGVFYERVTDGRRKLANGGFLCGLVGIVFFTLVKTTSLMGYVYETAENPYYLRQEDYGKYPLESYEVQGISFYYPESGDRVGYEAFPALPRKIEVCFRGMGIKEGFCASK